MVKKKERGKMKILVVDDEKMIREVVSEMLRHMGYDVILAEDPHEGLEKILEDFNLVITDYAIGAMSGIKFAVNIRQKFPNMPIVMITGHGSNEVKQPPEVDVLIFKPFKLTEILAAIEKAVKMHQPDAL